MRQGKRPATIRGAQTRVEVTLEDWPVVEVTFHGAEGLPAGALLRAAARAHAQGDRRNIRYRTEWMSGSLDSLAGPPSGGFQTVKDGVATLPVGDGVSRLSVMVSLGERGRVAQLQQVVPNEIVAGAPVTVQLSADEIGTAIGSLQQPPAKK